MLPILTITTRGILQTCFNRYSTFVVILESEGGPGQYRIDNLKVPTMKDQGDLASPKLYTCRFIETPETIHVVFTFLASSYNILAVFRHLATQSEREIYGLKCCAHKLMKFAVSVEKHAFISQPLDGHYGHVNTIYN